MYKEPKPNRLRVLQTRTGYLDDGVEIEGFADRKDLPDAERLLIAGWALLYSRETLTDAQRALLDAKAEEIKAARAASPEYLDSHLLLTPAIRQIERELSDELNWRLHHPIDSIGKDFPLSTDDLHKLTGLSKRQIQFWSDKGLLPCVRAKNGYREFGEAAAIIAAWLHGKKQYERQFLAGLCDEDDAADRLADLAAFVALRQGSSNEPGYIPLDLTGNERYMGVDDRVAALLSDLRAELPPEATG